MSVVALAVVMAGGAVATAGLGAVSRPAEVRVTAQRVDAGALVEPTIAVSPMQAAAGLVNDQRAARGLPPLDWSDQVAAAAHAHSTDMARNAVMQHDGSDGSDAGDRLRRAGFTWSSWGEAVAAGQPTAADVIGAWMNSPGHRAILLGSYDHIGIAKVTSSSGTPYWTLVAAS